MTNVTTLKGTKYKVSGLEGGKLVVRQPSGKRRFLGTRDTGRARFDAAVADFMRRGKA